MYLREPHHPLILPLSHPHFATIALREQIVAAGDKGGSAGMQKAFEELARVRNWMDGGREGRTTGGRIRVIDDPNSPL